MLILMPRRKIQHSCEFPYHITARANNKEWFYIEKSDCWQIFTEKLNLAREKFNFLIYAFVLMSNHYHLIGKINNDHNLGSIMSWLQKSISRGINRKANRINHVFGGPYKASLITKDTYYAHVLKYVYRNPVRAGICLDVQDYYFSTLNSKDILISGEKLEIASLVPEENKTLLAWLNTPLPVEYDEAISKSLKKSEMKIVDTANRKPHIHIMDLKLF